MKTSITDMFYQTPLGCQTQYLTSGKEIEAMVQEYQQQLAPCPHCGHPHVIILYFFQPCDQPHENYPHKVVAKCHKGKHQEPVGDCGCQSKVWYAKDDEQDLREALRLVVEGWNRRPK